MSLRTSTLLLGAAISGLCCFSPAQSALPHARTPLAAAISPDSRLVAVTVGSRAAAQLTVTEFDHPGNVQNVSPPGTCSNSAPVWSPDSQQLAFLSTCGATAPGQQQIFLYSSVSRHVRQLTHVFGDLQQLAWSPDASRLAFLFVENATRSAGALDAMKPWSGVIGEDGVEIQKVATADVVTGQTASITPSSLHVYEFGWSPDSASLTYIAANPPGENTWWIAQLYTQAARPDAPPHSILNTQTISGPLHGLQIAVPRFSPDGRQVAFIGGLMSDQGSTGGDLYTVSATGGQPKSLTPDRLASPAWFEWITDHTIQVSEDARGFTHLFRLDTSTLSEDKANNLRYMGSISSGGIKDAVSIARNGDVAVTRSSFDAPPEVWAGPIGSLKQLTHLNDTLKSAPARSESIEWTNEGFHVQGWLTFPTNYDSHRSYPMIVSVHGGPSAAVGARYEAQSTYAEAGYFVFQPNPRGSFGQGEKFVQANIKDFGYGDLRDILAGMDVVEKKVSIDRNREGLTGWSYGGFMTMFAVTQTHRFHAAVAGAGISDWKSYYGENSIDQWMTPFFGGSVYDDPAVYAKSSAIEFIKKVSTPTLVIVGDRDGECPAPQSFEFWHALRAEGVKTQLVIYPNEGHGFRDPAHIADRTKRELAWFADNMPASRQTAQIR